MKPRIVILIIDDEPQIHRFLKHSLAAAGYSLLHAETEDVREVPVDDTAVADDGDPLSPVGVDQLLDGIDRAGTELLRRLLVHVPLAAQHRLPARVVRCLQLLDRHVLARVAVPLGDLVDHDDLAAL